jgi:hypothetical protein
LAGGGLSFGIAVTGGIALTGGSTVGDAAGKGVGDVAALPPPRTAGGAVVSGPLGRGAVVAAAEPEAGAAGGCAATVLGEGGGSTGPGVGTIATADACGIGAEGCRAAECAGVVAFIVDDNC